MGHGDDCSVPRVHREPTILVLGGSTEPRKRLNPTRGLCIQYAVSESYTLALTSFPLALNSMPATRSMSESDLVSRAQEGDLTAFEELYRMHKGRVYALALRLTKDPTGAEDLTQEAFVRAWQKLSTFRGRSSFSTWLHRVAVNVVLAALRSAKSRSDKTTDLGAIEHRLTDMKQRRSTLEMDLERGIRLLPARARVVFVLHDIEGYRHAEIADLVGIAEGTSKAHLHRARRILREVLRQ